MLNVSQLAAEQGEHQFQWGFQLESGRMMAVVGDSGVGKSTLISTLLGFTPPISGSLDWCGQSLLPLPVKQRPFGVLFQKDNVFDHLTVRQNIALGLDVNLKLSEAQKSELTEAADRFGLIPHLNKRASDLSGGQQQRVALARVFLQNKPILLLDEPFSSLDKPLREAGLNWVKEIQQAHNTTVIMVTHHLDEVEEQVDCVLRAQSSVQWLQTYV